MSATAAASVTERTSETNMNRSLPMNHKISQLAYLLWEKRGCPEGSPEIDWLQAERELDQSSEYVSRVKG